MTRRFSLSLVTLSLLSTFNVKPLLADELIDQELEHITVTATRIGKANTELALSISRVNEQTLQQDQPQHLSESLQTISGVLVNQLSGGQGHNAAIRMPINYGGYTLYLQDGIPLQSAAFYNHNALWWASSNSSLSRLEVMKGAGTSLYGSGAVAATVNVISQPVSGNDTQIGVLFAEEGYQKYNLSKSAEINQQHGVRASAAYLSNDGWRDNSAIEKSEFNFAYEYQIDEQQSLTTRVMASRLDQQMSNSLNDEQFEEDPSQSGLPQAILDIDPRRETDYLRLSAHYEYDGDDAFYSAIPYLRYRTNDYTATWQPSMPQMESKVKSAGLLLLGNFSHQHDANTSVGIDLEYSEGDAYAYQPVTITTSGWGAATYPQGHVFYQDTTTFTGVAPYIQYQQNLTDALTLNLGARYDNNHYEFDNDLPAYDNDGFGNRSIASIDNRFEHISPKASINYLLTEQSSVYARFANAIRIPTAGELYHLKSKDTSDQLGQIKEETSDTFELGYKTNLTNLSIEAAIYYMDVTDGLITAYDDKGASYKVNAEKVSHKGFEFGATYDFSTQFNAALAYSVSRHEDKKKETSLTMAPKYVANARLNYQSIALDGFFATLEVQSIGDYWMDKANTKEYDGYTIANLKLNYNVSDALTIHARVNNLTDKKYALQAEVRYGRTRIQPGAPRTLYAGLNYRF